MKRTCKNKNEREDAEIEGDEEIEEKELDRPTGYQASNIIPTEIIGTKEYFNPPGIRNYCVLESIILGSVKGIATEG